MKFLAIVLMSVLTYFYACDEPAGKKVAASDRLVPEPDIIERLRYQKAIIDSIYYRNAGDLTVFNKMTGRDDLVSMPVDSIQEEGVETTYNILKDSSGAIVLTSEIPFSQSGDWHISVTHYFDKNGKTFAAERQSNFFNSGCTQGVAYETNTIFYNNAFAIAGKEYKLVDEKDKPLKKDSCAFLYDYSWQAIPDVAGYLKKLHIKAPQ
jgi:hypothetical protein